MRTYMYAHTCISLSLSIYIYIYKRERDPPARLSAYHSFPYVSEYNCSTCTLACCVRYWYYLVDKADFFELIIEPKETETCAQSGPYISTACRYGFHPSEATWPRAASKNEGTQVPGHIFELIVTAKGNTLGPKSSEKHT